jgi:ferritin-like metal-binding protein YciE
MADVLTNKFTELLGEIKSLEKQLSPIYAKMERSSHSAELSKCLHPEQTQAISHLTRIKLIETSLKNKAARQPQLALNKPKLKTPSLQQDLDIIQAALSFQNQKLASYELLHPLAHALGNETHSGLIEQTITDNRNTNTWLRQIVQNVIARECNKHL